MRFGRRGKIGNNPDIIKHKNQVCIKLKTFLIVIVIIDAYSDFILISNQYIHLGGPA